MGCAYSATIPDASFSSAWRESLSDLTGKVVAITGCTSGTGFVAAMECRRRGAKVILLNRASGRAQAALAALLNEGSNEAEDWRTSRVGHGPISAGSGGVGSNSSPVAPDLTSAAEKAKAEHVDCDLMSLDSIRAAAEKVLAIVGEGGLDVLCLNAGINFGKGDTKDGYEMVMQVNHMSHMLLLSLLYPSLEAASTQREEARVVFHTSMARMVVGMPKLMKEIMKDKTEGATKTIPSCAFAKAPREWPEEVKMFAKDDVVGTYGLSKACNFVCWAALHEKLLAKGSKVKSLIAHPGTAATDIFAKRFGKTFMTCIGNCMVRKSAHSDADGACPLLTCIAGSGVTSGEFYAPKGSDQMLGYESQTKGPPEKVVLADWERKVMTQGAVVWADTYAALGVEFDILPAI